MQLDDPFGAASWKQLGDQVRAARTKAGYTKTSEWAATVGRSTRTVLGLERGEPSSTKTVALVERALGWSDQTAYKILTQQLPTRIGEQSGLDWSTAMDRIAAELETLGKRALQDDQADVALARACFAAATMLTEATTRDQSPH